MFFTRVFCFQCLIVLPIKFMRKEQNIEVLNVVTGLNPWILSLVCRVSVTLNGTADHTDIFTTCAEVYKTVKENSDNRFDAGCRKRQLLSPTDLNSVLHSPRRSYSNYFNNLYVVVNFLSQAIVGFLLFMVMYANEVKNIRKIKITWAKQLTTTYTSL